VDQIVAEAAIFRAVRPEVISALTDDLRTVDTAPGDVFFTEGDVGGRMYIVLSGKVKIGCRAPDGRQKLFAVLGPSETFGEVSTLDPGWRNYTATALTHVRALVVPRDVLLAWVAQRPEIAQQMMLVLARRLRRADDDHSDLLFTDVAGRLAKQLLRLAQQFGVPHKGVLRVAHELTQGELSQLVGASRETVNKALSDFSNYGWIRLQSKTVLIVDYECLASRAREPASDHAGRTNAAGVDEAKRMIMERFGITATQANTLLTKLPQDSNTPVTDIAANIVISGSVLSIVG